MSFWRFVRMQAGSAEPARLYVDGEIWSDTPWWLEDGMVAAPDAFRREMDALDGGAVDVHVNSPGGDATAGVAIATLLRQHPGHTRCIIPSLAASAASLIPCGCDETLVGPAALIMIHNPATYAYGDHRDLARAKLFLDKLKDAVLALYCEKSKKGKDEIARMMDDECFMGASEAIEKGFADAVLEKPEKQTSMSHGYRAIMNLNISATQKAMEMAMTSSISAQEKKERAEILAWLKGI